MNYEKKYKEALEKARQFSEHPLEEDSSSIVEYIFPELKESEDEKIRKAVIEMIHDTPNIECEENYNVRKEDVIAWLEKQGSEPNWCHHKVDLSNCSEEYRKAYCDGWNNCNMQHSQCKSEGNEVVKCLINGMKFYYEGNEEATWGTEKFSMKVKDILSWLEKQGTSYTKRDVDDAFVEGMAFAKDELEKQGEKKPVWSEEDERNLKGIIDEIEANKNTSPDYDLATYDRFLSWLKSIKERVQPQNTWKPSDAQMASIACAVRKMKESACYDSELVSLYQDSKKLKG